jgi:hypothetical protein
MQPLHIVAVAGACIFVLFLIYKFFIKKQRPTDGWKNIPVSGLGVVSYDETEMGSIEVKKIIAELRIVRDVVWTKYQQLYGRSTKYYMDGIVLDFELGKSARMRTGPPRVWLNPGMNYVRGWAAELHNLYRCFTFGTSHIYCDEAVSKEDQKLCQKAQRIWQEY